MVLPPWKGSQSPVQWDWRERKYEQTNFGWYVGIRDTNPHAYFDTYRIGIEVWEKDVPNAAHSNFNIVKSLYGGTTGNWSVSAGSLIPGTKYQVRRYVMLISTKLGADKKVVNIIKGEDYIEVITKGTRPTGTVSPTTNLEAPIVAGGVLTTSQQLANVYQGCPTGYAAAGDGQCYKLLIPGTTEPAPTQQPQPSTTTTPEKSSIWQTIETKLTNLSHSIQNNKVAKVPIWIILAVVSVAIFGSLFVAGALKKNNKHRMIRKY